MQITNSIAKSSVSNHYTMNTGGINQDEQIKFIQKQIENVQKQLQSLSDNKEMSPEEMIEKRKELQQKIQDLNKQISQRKMEIQQEKRAATKVEKQEMRQRSTNYATIETATMQKLISADVSMKQVSTVQSIKTNMEGKVKVLKSEIKIDKGRGGSTERKEAELAELNDRINTASTDIMGKISDINIEIEESGEPNNVQDGIESKQGEDISAENTNTEKNEVSQSDVLEQKGSNYDKPVIYAKTGAASQQEPEVKFSLLV